jgi:hypothetical protein
MIMSISTTSTLATFPSLKNQLQYDSHRDGRIRMNLETVLTILLYVAAGWIALLGLKSFQTWRESRHHVNLMTGRIDVSASTVGIAYLVWWPLLLAVTWRWFLPFILRQKE